MKVITNGEESVCRCLGFVLRTGKSMGWCDIKRRLNSKKKNQLCLCLFQGHECEEMQRNWNSVGRPNFSRRYASRVQLAMSWTQMRRCVRCCHVARGYSGESLASVSYGRWRTLNWTSGYASSISCFLARCLWSRSLRTRCWLLYCPCWATISSILSKHLIMWMKRCQMSPEFQKWNIRSVWGSLSCSVRNFNNSRLCPWGG